MPKASDSSDRPPDGRQASRVGGADDRERMSRGGEAPELETRAAEAEAREVERLLRLASGGDSAAWRSIVSIYAPRVFGILRAQCRDDELAEEIAQSTFCTLAAKIASYIESGRFESWLFRIAMNRLRDEMRRRARHARSAGEETFASVAAPRDRPSGLDEDVRHKLETAMERLSESDREIIELRHTGAMSFRALSDYYDEPIGTLLARHHRALKKLKAMLEEMGVDGGGAG
ncbi:MAG: sigma-70 family RNA polymerase sigma factor [Planctomycetaceae bacterium]|nr:sigma-70 family RNA polymerase sigma factor [Planctomycetaceae bacterium]